MRAGACARCGSCSAKALTAPFNTATLTLCQQQSQSRHRSAPPSTTTPAKTQLSPPASSSTRARPPPPLPLTRSSAAAAMQSTSSSSSSGGSRGRKQRRRPRSLLQHLASRVAASLTPSRVLQRRARRTDAFLHTGFPHAQALLRSATSVCSLVNTPGLAKACVVSQASTGAQVVVKTWEAERVEIDREQLAAEDRTTAALQAIFKGNPHPLLVTMLVPASVSSDGCAATCSPYGGTSVSKLVQECANMPVEVLACEAQRMAACLLKAVGVLHKQGIMHRDIKLDNTVFDEDAQLYRLIDMGLCTALDGSNFFAASDTRYLDATYVELLSRATSEAAFCFESAHRQAAMASGATLDVYLIALACMVMLERGTLPVTMDPGRYGVDCPASAEQWAGYANAYVVTLARKWDLMPGMQALAALPDGAAAVDWFDKALQPDPAQRFQTARDALEHPWLAETAGSVRQALEADAPRWACHVAACRQWVDEAGGLASAGAANETSAPAGCLSNGGARSVNSGCPSSIACGDSSSSGDSGSSSAAASLAQSQCATQACAAHDTTSGCSSGSTPNSSKCSGSGSLLLARLQLVFGGDASGKQRKLGAHQAGLDVAVVSGSDAGAGQAAGSSNNTSPAAAGLVAEPAAAAHGAGTKGARPALSVAASAARWRACFGGLIGSSATTGHTASAGGCKEGGLRTPAALLQQPGSPGAGSSGAYRSSTAQSNATQAGATNGTVSSPAGSCSVPDSSGGSNSSGGVLLAKLRLAFGRGVMGKRRELSAQAAGLDVAAVKGSQGAADVTQQAVCSSDSSTLAPTAAAPFAEPAHGCWGATPAEPPAATGANKALLATSIGVTGRWRSCFGGGSFIGSSSAATGRKEGSLRPLLAVPTNSRSSSSVMGARLRLAFGGGTSSKRRTLPSLSKGLASAAVKGSPADIVEPAGGSSSSSSSSSSDTLPAAAATPVASAAAQGSGVLGSCVTAGRAVSSSCEEGGFETPVAAALPRLVRSRGATSWHNSSAWGLVKQQLCSWSDGIDLGLLQAGVASLGQVVPPGWALAAALTGGVADGRGFFL